MSNARTVTQKSNMKVLDLAYVAIGAAIIAVCSWISIPTAVPFTLQTFAVFFVLLLLGGERGTISILVYVLLGAVGVPVFAGFSGGLGVLLGKTGGYIIGFILMGALYIVITRIFGNKSAVRVVTLVMGLAVCYAFGTAWFMHIYMETSGEIGVLSVLSWCVFPFIIPDLAKLVLAFIIAKRVEPAIR